MGKKWIVVGYTMVILLFIGFSAYYFQQKKSYQKELILEKPLFPYRYVTAGDSFIEWKMKYFQPLLRGYLSKKETNYLVVEYPNDSGEWVEIYIFVTGLIGEGNIIKEIGFRGQDLVGGVSFEKLKEKLIVGEQIRIEYLAKVPDDYQSDNLCSLEPSLCLLAEMMAERKELSIGKVVELGSEDFEEFVVPAVSINVELYGK